MSFATTPRCDQCNLHEQAGLCSDEQQAKDAGPGCDEVDRCARACDRTDCGCIEHCYQNNPQCQTLTAALDRCTTQACDAYCR